MRGLMEETLRIRLKHVLRDVDRYGGVRFYYRAAKGLPKIRLPDDDQSPEFLKRYHNLQLGIAGGVLARVFPSALAGTFRWLSIEYLRSPAYRQLSGSTRARRKALLEAMMLEPVRPDTADTYAGMPVTAITSKALKVLRDRKVDLPEAANQRVRALRHLFKWAVEQEHLAIDPSRDLAKLAHKSAGHHTWTVEEVAQFEGRHPIGTKARLALALLLWTGARRSDVVLLGKQHVRGGWLAFTASKNKVRVEMPVLDCLSQVLDASPTGDLTYLVTEHGTPFDVAYFGNWFRKRCDEAGVPGSAHGLRKAGACTAAENGASTQQLMSVFGWRTTSEAERYTRAADRRKMAGDAVGMLVRRSQ